MARITMKQVKIWINQAQELGACDDDLEELNAIKTIKELRGHKRLPFWAYQCARDVIKGRLLEAEPCIMKHAYWAYSYACYVIKGRWPEAESYIMKNPEAAYFYSRHVIWGRWPEAEPYIMKDPFWALRYAEELIHGPWPEAQELILKDPYCGPIYRHLFSPWVYGPSVR